MPFKEKGIFCLIGPPFTYFPNMMDTLLEKFKTFIDEENLINNHDHILIAVSGGIDSVVLLDLLFRLRESHCLKLQLLHLNHGLRGKEADDDEKFVISLARKMNLPVITKKVHVSEYSLSNKVSEEEAARILRFRFFEETINSIGANSLALGHHANDQVETVLDHFLRGSGMNGLSGMKARRGKYIRPLLFATRREIETYASTHSLDFKIDSTNALLKYRRNNIRHKLIPLLEEEFNPGIAGVIMRTSKIMSETEAFLADQAEAAYHHCLIDVKKNKIILEIKPFLTYFTIIQKYVLFHAFDQLCINRQVLSSEKLERLITLIKGSISGKMEVLRPEVQVAIDHGFLVINKGKTKKIEICVNVGTKFQLPVSDLIFSSDIIKINDVPEKFSTNKKIEFIDFDKIGGLLKIRNFRRGDKFFPLNLSGEKKVSDFFTDLKVPLHLRKEIPFLICDSGIIWILGYRIDDRFKITNSTKNVLRVQIVEGTVE